MRRSHSSLLSGNQHRDTFPVEPIGRAHTIRSGSAAALNFSASFPSLIRRPVAQDVESHTLHLFDPVLAGRRMVEANIWPHKDSGSIDAGASFNVSIDAKRA